jgi:multiple sugar transport system substrate-binding protein
MSLGIPVKDRVFGCVLVVEPPKHTQIFPLPRQFPKSLLLDPMTPGFFDILWGMHYLHLDNRFDEDTLRAMQNKSRRFGQVISILIVGMTLAGCSSAVGEKDTPQATHTQAAPTQVIEEPALTVATQEVELPPPETATNIATQEDIYAGIDPTGQIITFWHPFTGIQEKTLQEIIDDFNTTNPWNISLQAVYQGSFNDLQDKMLTFMNTKDAPNLLVADETQVAMYQLGDALIDINQLADTETWGLTEGEKDDFFPGLIDQGVYPSFNGIRLSFPLYGTMNVLYYNADWLAEMGYGDPPGSPGVFLEAACTAMGQPFSGSTANGSMGFQLNINPASFADWAFAFGSKLFDYGSNQYIFNNNAIAEAMTFLQDMLNRGCATTDPSLGGDQVDFSRGVLLFAFESTDEIPDFRGNVQAEANFNWRIAPLPHTTNNPVTNVSGISASIPNTTLKGQLAAWLFLKHFTSPEVQARWVQATNALPVRAGTANFLGNFLANSPAYQMTFDLLTVSTSEPAIPGYGPVSDLSQNALREILEGANVPATLSQLSTSANLILDEQMALIPESPDPWVEVDPSGQTLTFWHQYTDETQAILDEIINEFNATNKWGITVVPENKGSYGDIFLSLLPVLGTDTIPNMVAAYQYHAAAYYQAGGLVDITSLVESTKWGLTPQEKKDFFTRIFQQDIFSVFDGARLGFPVQRSSDNLYYNADWLAELGYDEPPASPDEFKQMACAATTPYSKSSTENSLGYYFYLDASRFSSWVFAFGGDIFDENTNRFTYNTGEVEAVVTFMLDLIEAGCAAPILDRDQAQEAFGNGSLLFMVDSSFHIPTVSGNVEAGANFDWAVAAIPSLGGEPVQNVFGASISIPASTPQAELATWIFLKYFTSPEVQARWVQTSSYLPIRASAADHLSDYFADNPNYQAAFHLLPYGIYEPSVPGYDFVQQEVELAVEAILGGADVSETLDSLNATANQILAVQLER